MTGLERAIKDFMQIFQDAAKKGTSSYDTRAEVLRIEDGKAWVHIPGGVDETPVDLTIDAKVGDTVLVRIGGGRAHITGNATAPPTDDTTARSAQVKAGEASAEAGLAQETANEAGEAANEAQSSANNAQLTAERAEDSVDTVSDSLSELSEHTNGEFLTVQEVQANLDSRMQSLAESVSAYDGYLEVDKTAPYIKIASNSDNYILITGNKVSMVADSQETAYMSSSRFYAPSAVVANLFMQIRDPSTGNRVGKLGTLMRSNGHYSLKRIF